MKIRKIAIAVGLLIAACAVVPILWHYHLRAATHAYLVTLKAQGEPMELAQVLPPRLSPEDNSAETVRKVEVMIRTGGSLLSTNSYYSMKMVAPGEAMIGWRQPDAREFEVTNSWAQVHAAVAKNEDAFRLLRSLIEKPQFDFGIDYDRGVSDITFSNFCLVECKRDAQRLQVAILDDLRRGDGASAIQNNRAILAIVKGMSEERLVISELVRIAIANIAMASTWEILQSTNLPEKQLAELQSDWASLDFLRAQEHALEMERAAGAISLKKYRSSNSGMMNILLAFEKLGLSDAPPLSALDKARLKWRVIRWQYWWSYSDEMRALKGYQAVLDAPRSARTNYALLATRENAFAKIYDLSITNANEFAFMSDPMKGDLHYFLSSSITTLWGAFNRVLKAEAAKQLTTAAVALERYHIQHSTYPETLTALVPQFLPDLPRDPIDGQPIRYRRQPDGSFLLYSIGDDGKDDGGDPTSSKAANAVQWQSGRDWVWPRPATKREIESFFSSPPK